MYQYATKSMFLVIVLLTSCLLGCRDAPTSVVAEFEPNMVYAYKQSQEYELAMDGALEQTTAALEEVFGTPDDPKIPAIVLDDPELSSIVSMEHLMAASGPAEAPGRGLYRKHCALCHGVTGNGRGTSAAILPVYPRDYRLGRFKFKSTPRGVKPTKANIAYLIKHGIAGTSMVKIVPELSDEEIAALVDYVVYLSWRGKVERDLLFEAADSEEPDSIYNVALKTSEDEEERELFQDNLDLLEEFVVDAAESWLDMEERALELPQRDPAVVPDTVDEVLSAMASDEPSPIKESVARGMALFTIDKAACFKCHGKQGRGDGENNDYDDWAKDWAKDVGMDKPERHVPYIARGALPVRKVSPRNFEQGVFRGGGAPEKLYERIALGIEGTPMPAAMTTLQPEEIWDLVNFVRSLAKPSEEVGAASEEAGAVSDNAAAPEDQASAPAK